jgi:hypothetical protein
VAFSAGPKVGAFRLGRTPPDNKKRKKLSQPKLSRFLRQRGPSTVKAPANQKLPADQDFGIDKVHDLRKELVTSQTYLKAFQTHYHGGSVEACKARKDSFLSEECGRDTTSIFAGDVEVSAYALARHVKCRVWELRGDDIHPHGEEFACTDAPKKEVHFLFSQSPDPERPGESLRCGHFDLLLPEEDLPQGRGSLRKFCPQNAPPLFQVPCPKNGHCLFFAMAFLDELLAPTVVKEAQGSVTDEELAFLAESSESDASSSSDATFHH